MLRECQPKTVSSRRFRRKVVGPSHHFTCCQPAQSGRRRALWGRSLTHVTPSAAAAAADGRRAAVQHRRAALRRHRCVSGVWSKTPRVDFVLDVSAESGEYFRVVHRLSLHHSAWRSVGIVSGTRFMTNLADCSLLRRSTSSSGARSIGVRTSSPLAASRVGIVPQI